MAMAGIDYSSLHCKSWLAWSKV